MRQFEIDIRAKAFVVGANVPEAQWLLRTKSIIVGRQRSGCTGFLCRSKSSSGAGKKGKSGNSLHGDRMIYLIRNAEAIVVLTVQPRSSIGSTMVERSRELPCCCGCRICLQQQKVNHEFVSHAQESDIHRTKDGRGSQFSCFQDTLPGFLCSTLL